MMPGKLVFCVGLALSATAMADLPPAMDRAPTDAAFVISVRQISTAMTKIENFTKAFPIPMEEFKLDELKKMLDIDGINKDGSAALAMLSTDKVDGEDPVVLIIPVKEYNGFAKALGADGGNDLDAIEIDGNPAYIKDIGGGYAAMGPVKSVLEAFKGAAGNNGTHSKMVGKQGQDIAEGADAIAMVNLVALRPKIEEGIKEMKEGMENDPTAPKEIAEKMAAMMDGFARDAQAAVIGLSASDAGVRLDGSTQFAEKSEWASYFADKKGEGASKLLAKLPSQPYFIAAAVDMSGAGTKKLLNTMMDFTLEAAKAQGGPDPAEMMGGIDLKMWMEKAEGMSFIFGSTPAIMGAPFINTSSFLKTSDPAGFIGSVKDMYAKMDGKNIQGMTYKTKYEPGVANVAGTSVDAWGMTMEADKNNPEGEQMAQMQAMIFGPDGMGGYLAPATGGVVQTMAKNQPYLETALKAANGGGGLDTEAGVKSVASQLPANRNGELYIGVKTILDTVGAFLPMEIDAPANLQPIALASSSSEGGLRMTFFMPQGVMNIIAQISNQGNVPMENEDDGSGQPKF